MTKLGGFQILHAVYAVERFLENLIKRHCQFHIAFFEGMLHLFRVDFFADVEIENAELCIPSGATSSAGARYLLARSLIKRHLTSRLPASCPEVAVNTFSSLESEKFREYLHVTPIHFVMTHDGSGCKTRSVKTLLRGIIWWFNVHKLNVALINRIEFQDSKVFTIIVESFTPNSVAKLEMTAKFSEEIGKARTVAEEKRQEDEPNALTSLEPGDHDALEEAFSDEDMSEHFLLAAYSVSKILKAQKFDVFMASAMTMHIVLLKHVPLSQRRLPLVTFDKDFEEQIDDFIREVSNVFRHAIDSPTWKKLMSEEGVETDTVDAIDGRLFRIIMQSMCDGSIKTMVPPAARPDWVDLSALVTELAGEGLSLEGSAKPTSSKSSAKKGDFEYESGDLTVLPFTNAVFDKHLECIHVETDASLPARPGGLKMYRETTHWHNYKKPLNPKLAPVQKVSKWR